MKKIVFLSLALLVCTLCSAKKSVKKQVQDKVTQEEILDSLKMVEEFPQVQAEKEENLDSIWSIYKDIKNLMYGYGIIKDTIPSEPQKIRLPMYVRVK